MFDTLFKSPADRAAERIAANERAPVKPLSLAVLTQKVAKLESVLAWADKTDGAISGLNKRIADATRDANAFDQARLHLQAEAEKLAAQIDAQAAHVAALAKRLEELEREAATSHDALLARIEEIENAPEPASEPEPVVTPIDTAAADAFVAQVREAVTSAQIIPIQSEAGSPAPAEEPPPAVASPTQPEPAAVPHDEEARA